MKKNKLQILAWILALLPLVLIAALYSRLPDQVPMQWQFDGTAEYRAKTQLWLIGALSPFLMVMLGISPRIDPKRHNYDKFHASYILLKVILMLFILIMVGITLIEALRPGTVNVIMIVCIGCGLLFTVLGNMMPKFRLNWFFGIRTPWTISNEKVWLRTQRLGGRLMFASGFVIIAAAFVPNNYARMGAILLSAFTVGVIPMVCSWWWYRQSEQQH